MRQKFLMRKMQDNRYPLSVVIITKNEQDKLPRCLESVKWADEIIVVDDYSSDKTIEIAERYTDRIFQRKIDAEGKHRNWAYAQAKNAWVLSLDADEWVTEELKEDITRVLEEGPKFNGYVINRRNYIGDYWVRYGGWYPGSQLKFFRKDKFKYEEAEVHPRVFYKGEWGHLKGDILHYSYKDFSDFLTKLNRQTTLEATKWVKDGRKMSLFKASWRTVDRFFRTYVRKKGYKDGFIGFVVAFFGGLYQIISYFKYWEILEHKKETGF